MLKNYLKIFSRNLVKHPGYTLSNLSSLAVGMTTCILILLFVRYEMNWNTYNKNYDHAYRVQQKVLFKNDVQIYGKTGYLLASELKKQVPEIEDAACAKNLRNQYLSSSDELTFFEKYGCYADGEIFNVLTFEFLKGDPATALTDPFSVVLTQALAEKYFPDQDAYGKVLKASKDKSLKVTGIIKNLPFNSDFRPTYIVSMSTYNAVSEWKGYQKAENIDAAMFYTFVTLKPNVSLKAVNEKLYNFQDQYLKDNYKKLYLKPLPELHLTANEKNDVEIALEYIGAFAIFVLILACINFINLSTANSFLRKKEIGIRKVTGASRKSLFLQFISESILFTFFSMINAFCLVEILIPYFNAIVDRPLTLNFIHDFRFIMMMAAIFISTGFLSGIYPAIYLSGFRPAQIIRGDVSLFKKRRKGSSKSFIRKSLVTAQFCISVILLTSTIYVANQVHFMKTKDLGFDKHNLIISSVYGKKESGRFETLRNKLLNNPDITDATLSENAPFHGDWWEEINWEGATSKDKIGINYNQIDYDYINTYKMKIELGRNFSRKFPADDHSCLINETAMKKFGWINPIGKKIDDNKYTVIGVVKDFHPYSVHEKIPPCYMVLNSGNLDDRGMFAIRIKEGSNKENVADFTRKTFRTFFPDAIIETTLFDTDLNYSTKGVWEIVEKVFFGFAIIAILIAANGLFGMISFASQRRMKEIGVRKVFGAATSNLYLILSKEFILILIISALMTFPAGYFVSHTTPGAYKYQMQFGDYFYAIIIMIITTLFATIYHTTKAVFANPVETLRYE